MHVLAFVLIMLAGCGSDGRVANPSPTASVPAPTPTATAAAGRAFAVGLSGLLRSDDGGRTWSVLPQSGQGRVSGLDFLDRMIGWTVSNEGDIFHTTDGGLTFSDQGQNITGVTHPTFALRDVVFLDAQRGFALGGGNPDPMFSGPPLILVTADAGAHWTPAAIGYGLHPGAAPGNSIVGSVCLTTNGVGLAHGFATWAGNLFLRSEDGGVHWWDITERLPEPALAWWAGGVACAGEADLWIGLVHSSDGGQTWVDQSASASPDANRRLNRITFADSLTGWAVGETAAEAPPPILHTTDGGQHWIVQVLPPGTLGRLTSVAFLDNTRGVAVGSDWTTGQGAIGFVTEDGGESWVASSFPTGIQAVWDVSLVP